MAPHFEFKETLDEHGRTRERALSVSEPPPPQPPPPSWERFKLIGVVASVIALIRSFFQHQHQ